MLHVPWTFSMEAKLRRFCKLKHQGKCRRLQAWAFAQSEGKKHRSNDRSRKPSWIVFPSMQLLATQNIRRNRIQISPFLRSTCRRFSHQPRIWAVVCGSMGGQAMDTASGHECHWAITAGSHFQRQKGREGWREALRWTESANWTKRGIAQSGRKPRSAADLRHYLQLWT
jgi:hypothetical protein